MSLIALKVHAIRYGPDSRKDRDWLDIKSLIQAADLRPDDAKLKAVFERHGTAGLYTELLERCSHG